MSFPSRAEKMLSAIGIRLQKDGLNSEWKIAPHQGSSEEKDTSVENSPSHSRTTEMAVNLDVIDKENSTLEINTDYRRTDLNTSISPPKHPKEADVMNTNLEISGISDVREEGTTTPTISIRENDELGCCSTKRFYKPSSPSNSRCSNDSSGSISDFSSDDSVKDPNYMRQSSSSDSDDDVDHVLDQRQIFVDEVTTEVRIHSELSEPVKLNNQKRTRKRKPQPSSWNKNRIKRLRNSGKSYKTYSKGVDVAARSIKPPCDSEKCKYKCTTKYTEQERLILFENYWAMANIVKQRTYISTLMEDVNPTKEKNRVNNHAFYFWKNGIKTRVCKLFFTSTLGITNRCIRTIISKKQEGSLGDDLRGKHDKHRQVSQDIKDGIRAHISSIPVIESHYIRAHSQKVYIEGGKTIAQLYRDYRADCQRENKPYAKFSMYREIFNHEFNIAFFIPKKDQCQTCVAYHNSSEDERRTQEDNYVKHQEEKALSREEKMKDKSLIAPDYKVVCYDLQAALTSPNGQVSSFYYKSKLSSYNFTVCHLEEKGQGSVYCFMWHEGEGKRGAIEIGTCLLKFLKETAEKADSENLEIVLYSDNCAGQQKNKFVLAAFLYAVANYKIKTIIQKYLVTGHTQNEGDNVHSLIEKNIKRALKSGPIYTPAQYVTLVQTAKRTGHPFKVIELTHGDFFDLKKLTEKTVLNTNINSEGQNFKFSEISILKVEKEHTNMFYYKNSFKENAFKSVNIIKERRTRNPIATPSFGNFILEKAYQEKIPISRKKYEDLMFLVRSNAIIKSHSDFYVNLSYTDK